MKWDRALSLNYSVSWNDSKILPSKENLFLSLRIFDSSFLTLRFFGPLFGIRLWQQLVWLVSQKRFSWDLRPNTFGRKCHWALITLLVGDQYHDLETIIIYYCDHLVGRGVVSASLILVWIYLNQELQKHVLLKEVNLFQYSLKSITGHIAHAESHHLFHYESRSHQRWWSWRVNVPGIPEALIEWGQNSRLVANGTNVLNLWDSPLFQVPPSSSERWTNHDIFLKEGGSGWKRVLKWHSN